MKTLTKDSVLDTAEALMTIYGKTTTLDVKKELRFQGYFVTQDEISFVMHMLCLEEGWTFLYNGKFRTYYLNKTIGSISNISGFTLN